MIKALRKSFTSYRQQYFVGGSLLVYSNIISTVTNLGIVYIFANFVSQETYGTYKYILSIASVLSIFTLQGMNTAIVQSVSRGFEGAVREGVRTKIIFGFIGTLFGLFISGYYFLQENPILGGAFLVTALAIPFYETFNLYRAYLNGKRQYKEIAKETTFYSVAYFVVFAATLLITDNIVIIMISYFLASTLLQLFIYHKISRRFDYLSKSSDIEITRYGKDLSLMKGLSVASGSVSSLALWHILGPLSLPTYALALAPIEQVRPILQMAENLLMPKLSQDSWKAHSMLWFFKKTALFFLAILLFVVTYIVLAPFIFALVFPKYMESILLSQVYSVSLLLTGLNILLFAIMRSKKQISKLYFTNGISMLFDFLSIPSIYLFGIIGLIINILLGKLVISIVGLYMLFKK
ncbi:MAG: oligosaccharide flippase family protein [Candidatus Pacebacteria bacterium]|nr:oligosaccharide flippase family protein [Candidatus Paceibacterota bacterium]